MVSSSLNILEALEAMSIEYVTRGVEANALCPMHERMTGKEDRNPSWWINVETGAHICFSCHYKGNLLQLICDIHQFYTKTSSNLLSYDYNAARNWLSGVSETPVEVLLERLRSMPVFLTAPPKLLPMSEARLAVYTAPTQAALDSRGITETSAEKYGVLWDASKEYWILPLRDPETKNLLGWQEKGTKDRYFRNRPAGLVKSKTLFGIENQDERTVIVVESPLDCVRMDSAGIPGAVAVCGSSISEEQVKLLRFSSKVIAAFDNPNSDAAGAKAAKEMLQWDRKYGLNLFFFNYGSSSKKDPGDMTAEELDWGIRNAISAIYGEQAYVQRNTQAVSN